MCPGWPVGRSGGAASANFPPWVALWGGGGASRRHRAALAVGFASIDRGPDVGSPFWQQETSTSREARSRDQNPTFQLRQFGWAPVLGVRCPRPYAGATPHLQCTRRQASLERASKAGPGEGTPSRLGARVHPHRVQWVERKDASFLARLLDGCREGFGTLWLQFRGG